MKTKLSIALWMIMLSAVGHCYAQDLGLRFGLSSSSLDFKRGNYYDDWMNSPFVAVHADYLNMGNFYLSSEIGYGKKGGRDKDVIDRTDEMTFRKTTLKESWGFVNLNTMIKYRIPFNSNRFFLGIGPSLDLLTDRKTTGSDRALNRVYLSARAELGFEHSFKNHFKLGMSIGYAYGLTYAGSMNANKFRCDALSTSLLLGYSFGGH